MLSSLSLGDIAMCVKNHQGFILSYKMMSQNLQYISITLMMFDLMINIKQLPIFNMNPQKTPF